MTETMIRVRRMPGGWTVYRHLEIVGVYGTREEAIDRGVILAAMLNPSVLRIDDPRKIEELSFQSFLGKREVRTGRPACR